MGNTVTSLGFDIISAWDGAGVVAARADLGILAEEMHKISGAALRIGVMVDDAEALTQMAALEAKLANRIVSISVVADTAAATAELDATSAAAKGLGTEANSLSGDFTRVSESARVNMTMARDQFEQSGLSMSASANKVLDSVTGLAVAEARLTDTIAAGTATTAQMIAAQNDVAVAHTRVADTANAEAAANQRLMDELPTLAAETNSLTAALNEQAAAAGRASEAIGTAGATGATSGFGAALNTVGKTSAVAFGVGVALAVNQAGDFQNAMQHLVTSAGLPKDAMDDLGQSFKDLSVETGTSATDLAAASYKVLSLGFDWQDTATIMHTTAQLAKIDNSDLTVTTQAVVQTLHDYHMATADNVDVANALRAAVERSNTTLGDFTDGIGRAEQSASALHISYYQVYGALATLTQQGLPASTAIQLLTTTMDHLAASTPKSTKELEALGLNAVQFHATIAGPNGLTDGIGMLNDAIANKLGPDGLVYLQKELKNSHGDMNQFLQDIGAAPQDIQTTVGALGDAVGGVRNLSVILGLSGENLDGFKDNVNHVAEAANGGHKEVEGWDGIQQTFNQHMSELKESVRTAAITVGQDFLPALTNVVDAFRGSIEWLDKHEAVLRGIMIVLGTLGALWLANKINMMAYAVAMTAVKVATVAWTFATEGATAGMAALDVAMDANPIGAIVLAIEALIAVIVIIATKTTWFQTAWTYTWNAVKAVAEPVWNWIKNTFNTIWGGIKDAFGAVMDFIHGKWGWLLAIFGGPIGALIILAANWDKIWTGIKIVAAAIWDWMQHTWDTILSAINATYHRFIDPLVAAWNIAWNTVKTVFSAIWDTIKKLWEAVTQEISDRFHHWLDNLVAWWGPKLDAVRQVAVDVWNKIKAYWDLILNDIKQIWETVSNAISTSWNAVWNAIKDVVTPIWNWIRDTWNTIINGVKATWDVVSQALSQAWNDVWTAIKNFVDPIWQWFVNTWHDFLTGAKAVWDTVSQALSDSWNTVWNAIKNFITPIWQWLVDTWHNLVTGVKAIWDTTSAALSDAWNTMWNAVHDTAQGIWDKIQAGWDALSGGVRKTIQFLVDEVKRIWDQITDVFKTPVNAVINVWNHVSGAFGLDNIPGLATGGEVDGEGTATSDSVLARLSKGEHVWTAAEVDAVGGQSEMYGLRESAMRGDLHKQRIGDINHDNMFADGGAVDRINAAKSMAQEKGDGRAYVYGGSGPDGFDCSGYQSAIYSVLEGLSDIWSRKFSTESDFGSLGFQPGLGAGYSIGVMHGGGGPNSHMAGTLDGTNAESGGPHNSTLWGGSSVGADNPEFDAQWHLPIIDGQFVSGGMGSGSSGPSPEQIRMHDEAVAQIQKIIDDTNQTSATRKFKVAHEEGVPLAVMDAKGAQNIYGTWAPAGDTHAAGTDDQGTGAIHKLDAALAALYRSGGSIGGTVPTGDQLRMIDESLKLSNTPPPSTLQAWEAGMNTLVTRESGWNTGAVNGTDSNAAAGNPSKGLAQTTQTTFDAYAVPGHTDIMNGVDNMAAAENYIKARYGSIENVQQANANMPPKGYATGTTSAQAGLKWVGENGPEMVNFKGGEQVHSFDETLAALKKSATDTGVELGTKVSADLKVFMDRLTAAVQAHNTDVASTLRTEIQSLVDQMSTDTKGASQRLTVSIEDALDRIIKAAGINLTIPVTGGGTMTPQAAQSLAAELLPKLQMMLQQQVGAHS